MATVEYIFRVFDFHVFNAVSLDDNDGDDAEQEVSYVDNKNFYVQMFGVDKDGQTYSVHVEGFSPFFYVLVDDSWTKSVLSSFIDYIKKSIPRYYAKSITEYLLIKRRKLYGFDGGKEHKFVRLKFANTVSFNRVKKLWYTKSSTGSMELSEGGFLFETRRTYLYEANIPPLLRFFHLREMSPSGWIAIPANKAFARNGNSKVNCHFEFVTDYKNILPLNQKEDRVPYKIMSFDIEASSSHGDFPVPVKTYKKLATNIVEYFEKLTFEMKPDLCAGVLRRIVLAAFGYEDMAHQVDLVYPKEPPKNKEAVEELVSLWLGFEFPSELGKDSVEAHFEKLALEAAAATQEGEDEIPSGETVGHVGVCEEVSLPRKRPISHVKRDASKTFSVVDLVMDKGSFTREEKLTLLNTSFTHPMGDPKKVFPPLEGDKVTFIGSTFMRYGEKDPYFNHCIVLNTCAPMPNVPNSELETYRTEREVLLAWQRLVQRENPDIVIGYNIFGFDYEFLFRRAIENQCQEQFLKLSRNVDEICGTKNEKTGKWQIEESVLQIASGQHDLHFIKMNGRLQVDLYNYYRREVNLSSYKLDYVAGNFIGDDVKSIEEIVVGDTNQSRIFTSNLTGLLAGSFVHFEEIGYSVDYYADGAKFLVALVEQDTKSFLVQGLVRPDFGKTVRWCMAKDDVTPKDIFEMTNGTDEDRAIIAKYCVQDCNLVHYLFNKSDILTGFIEMANICSVPINFLVMRGQGIKLTSYIAKKCRDRRTLMPVIEKGDPDEGYEGAIVLDPKCKLYLKKPVAVGDYASLYPSSMISENISHDTKVWTKEYDLAGNEMEVTGEKDPISGQFIYDNVAGYQYVDISYDTYRYFSKGKGTTREKRKIGTKICRYVQPDPFTGQREGIMVSILKELLKARKDTRAKQKKEKDAFMWQVLEQRQLGYKVTANSLYGQCGAKTSTFYEKDIAASTTATGRKLLTYAKRIVEECYGGNRPCETTKYGIVHTSAEYIYGDSVAYYTPLTLRIRGSMCILTMMDLAAIHGKGHWVVCEEPGKETKEYCELEGVESWTEKGWTKVFRVIRHRLASHKKMIRVTTHRGSTVDVTDDHSLLTHKGKPIQPRKCTVDTTYLLTRPLFGDASKERVTKIEEIPYDDYVYDLTTENHHFAAGVGDLIVHNTDSVFFTFNLKNEAGADIEGQTALEVTIELAQQACHLASSFLKKPHDFEYEKTFMPLCLLSKKRYVGMLYEKDPEDCHRKEMGIVLKRRDNAPIVKDIYGGIIDILMKKQDVGAAIQFLRMCLQDIIDEKFPMEKLIITKSLRSGYKNPQGIAHKVLADRITARDPGNKPGPGDRIPFVYIVTADKNALQGEKIETPSFIVQNHLKIDYSFYITNQIMKPVQQLFALVLEDMFRMDKHGSAKLAAYEKKLAEVHRVYGTSGEKFEEKWEALRCKEVKTFLFDPYLRETNNTRTGHQTITKYAAPLPSPDVAAAFFGVQVSSEQKVLSSKKMIIRKK